MHIVIIGNGISGITAARYIRKLCDHDITVISYESEYFFARTALMYLYMRQMTLRDITPYEPWSWKKNRISLKKGLVINVLPDDKTLELDGGTILKYDRLIIATGSRPVFPDIPGIELDGVLGFYSMQDLESLEKQSTKCRTAVIVGGGLIGIELAEMLSTRDIDIHMIVRESGYYGDVLPPEESEIINREIRRHGINLHLNTTVVEMSGEEKVESVITSDGKTIQCDLVAVATGVKPNIEFLSGSGIDMATGILADHELRTNYPDILAIGDCAEVRNPKPGRRAIEPAWYTGRIMGEVAGHNVCGFHVPYEPGTWFNSAKFFCIEYMVYGEINPQNSEHTTSFYWEYSDKKKSLRINFNTISRTVTGFNALGLRLRQDVCEKWLRESISIDDVMEQLSLANFDPELSHTYEQDILLKFNHEYRLSINLRQSRSATASAKYVTN